MKRKLLVVAIVVGVMTFLASAFAYAMPIWGDGFEGYAPGTVLDNVNGWKGWGDVPAQAGVVSNAQARSGLHSIAIGPVVDAVREFPEYNTTGVYDVVAWTYVPGNSTGNQYFILLNTYTDAGNWNWSTQLYFNQSTNMIVTDQMTFPGSAPLIEDQWVELRVRINFDANTQTLYYNGAQFATGSWTEGSSGGGALSIGAMDLYSNGGSTIYYDDISITPADFTINNSISANLTVSTDGSCGTSNTTNADYNSTVTYCYQVMNTGNVTYDLHTVSDSLVGTVLATTTLPLAPGGTYSLTRNQAFTTEIQTNDMMWTAWVSGTGIITMDGASATVTGQPTDVALTAFGGDASMAWLLPAASLTVLVMLAGAMILRRRQQI